MKKTLPEIQAAIVGGEITAITLDTSIFDAQQNDLEHGLLRRLSQFKDSDTSVLMTDVVLREVDAHLLIAAEEVHASVREAKKLVARRWRHESAKAFEDSAQLLLSANAASMVKARLDAFCAVSGLVEVKADQYVKAGDVINRYFASQPPFGAKESKKHEFPDAFALLALEAWAAEADTYVLVVTRDGDWISYCAVSERLIALEDLSVALGSFQKETARYACQRMLELFAENDPLELKAKTLKALNNQVYDKIKVDIEAHSQFMYEEDIIEMDFSSFEIQTGTVDAVEPVDFGEDYVVVSMKIRASGEFRCHFGFDVFDSIDRDYVSMGSGSALQEKDITVQVLVTLVGDLPKKMEIDEVEVLPRRVHLDLGEIEPDWMDDRDVDLFSEDPELAHPQTLTEIMGDPPDADKF